MAAIVIGCRDGLLQDRGSVERGPFDLQGIIVCNWRKLGSSKQVCGLFAGVCGIAGMVNIRWSVETPFANAGITCWTTVPHILLSQQSVRKESWLADNFLLSPSNQSSFTAFAGNNRNHHSCSSYGPATL
jgi:hypothetical protein